MAQTLGERIADYRKQKNLTQEQLASAMGVSSQAVSKWENDLSCPDIHLLPQLAQFFDISVDALLSGAEALQEEVLQEEAALPEEEPLAAAEEQAAKQTNFFVRHKRALLRTLVSLVSLAVIFALLAAFVNNQIAPLKDPEGPQEALFTKHVPTTYPYVFVHGLNGWGEKSNSLLPVNYWGGGTSDLMAWLKEQGYTCCAPSGSPAASAWDRACELYGALTGTTVDYGEAHAKQFGHPRYGEAYTEALVPQWGEEDAHGSLIKINLIGHSFGGASSRMLSELLANGDKAEQEASGEGCSPLFEGGKAEWVYSVTALAAPHNGTTLLYTVGGGEKLIGSLMQGLGFLRETNIGKALEGALGNFGVSADSLLEGQSLDDIIKLSATKDNAYYDLTLHGAKELNERIHTLPQAYYFSLPVDGTKDSGSRRVGTDEMMLPLRVPAAMMGAYSVNKQTDIPIDSSWLPNDGLVNTVSETAPSNAEQIPFDETTLAKGQWMVYPTLRGDHGTPIGLMQTEQWTHEFYQTQMERIDSLSRVDTVSPLQRTLYRWYQWFVD